jgi:5-epi-alpha-selinene synthase
LIEPIILPTLFCPLPSAINPQVEAVQTHNLTWVRRFRLVQQETAERRFHASKFGWLAARAYPLAGLEELKIVCDWNVWLFLLDDHCDEGQIGKSPERLQPVFADLFAILQDDLGAFQPGPLASSLRDLWQRMSARSTPAWRVRFRRDAQEYFAACLWEATNRANGVQPSVRDYIAQRPLTGGLITDVDLIDLTEHLTLPDEVRESELVQRLTVMANNVVCWSNDIISLRKEMERGDVHNLVLAIQQEERCSLQAAVEYAAHLHDAEVRGFLALEQRQWSS